MCVLPPCYSPNEQFLVHLVLVHGYIIQHVPGQQPVAVGDRKVREVRKSNQTLLLVMAGSGFHRVCRKRRVMKMSVLQHMVYEQHGYHSTKHTNED